MKDLLKQLFGFISTYPSNWRLFSLILWILKPFVLNNLGVYKKLAELTLIFLGWGPVFEISGPGRADWADSGRLGPARPGGIFGPSRPGPGEFSAQVGPARPGPEKFSARVGPAQENFEIESARPGPGEFFKILYDCIVSQVD